MSHVIRSNGNNFELYSLSVAKEVRTVTGSLAIWDSNVIKRALHNAHEWVTCFPLVWNWPWAVTQPSIWSPNLVSFIKNVSIGQILCATHMPSLWPSSASSAGACVELMLFVITKFVLIRKNVELLVVSRSQWKLTLSRANNAGTWNECGGNRDWITQTPLHAQRQFFNSIFVFFYILKLT